jgi:hypothetical protein
MEPEVKDGRQREAIQEKDLAGFKYFRKVLDLLARLHDQACDRDTAGNRVLHYDQHIALILLYLFNPIVSSLRAIAQVSTLEKVQRKLGIPKTNVVSLSEANRIFDASLLRGIIQDLARQLRPLPKRPELRDIQGILTLVDSSLITALPKLVQAMWLDEEHKAVKLHTHFELLSGVPDSITVGDGNSSDWQDLASRLLPGRVYVMDRGYACFELLQKILDTNSSFVCRVRDNSVYEVIEQLPLSEEAKAAGVVSDRLVRLGGESSEHRVRQTLRLVEVRATPHRKRMHGARGGPEQGDTILIATDMLDVPAEAISLLYRERWGIEIFFRFFKHTLTCRHLLAHNRNGIAIQCYAAIIACLLLALWTGKKPTRRTYEMFCYHLIGWASEEELDAHIQGLPPVANKA